jgi:dTDP-4-amino-4,6-dideoxygalactose transaminase
MGFVVPKEPNLDWRALLRRPGHGGGAAIPAGGAVFPLFWARNAVCHGLRLLGVAPGESVLVPSYHCSALVEPVLRHGARAVYYGVRPDCSPDLDDIERRIDAKTRAILVVHYFGFPQRILEIESLCRTRGLFLIEDCAHVLRGSVCGRDLGTFGDVSFFSWRKLLPLYDGAHLVVNRPDAVGEIPIEGQGVLFALKVAKHTVARALEDSPFRHANVLWRLARLPFDASRRMLGAAAPRPAVLATDRQSPEFDPRLVNAEMSGLSRRILGNLDIEDAVARRRRNYRRVEEALRSLPGIAPLHPELPDGVCPWVLPVFAGKREDFHLALRSKGVPAVTWGGVIHPSLPLAEFPVADELYRTLVFLPIHQGIAEPELEASIDVIRSALRQGASRP